MTVARTIDAHTLGRRFWEATAEFNAPIHEIWVRDIPGIVDTWIITLPVELDDERRVYRVAARVRDSFPKSYLDFHVLNPSILDEMTDPHDLLPQGVVRVDHATF